MILAVDIGNTHIVMGVMDGFEIVKTVRITTNKLKTDFEYAVDIRNMFTFFGLDPAAVDGAIISSVVPPLTASMEKALKLAVGVTPLIVGKGVKTGVNILLEDPGTAGADLVAAAAGALKLYTPPLILIDMGTATTVTVIDKNGAFIGGVIAVGLALGIQALSSGTSQLPNVSFDPPSHAIGRNTVDSIRSGAILGAAAMLDGKIARVEDEQGHPAQAVATGGLAGIVVPLCRREVTLDDSLLLTGLAAIYERNRKI